MDFSFVIAIFIIYWLWIEIFLEVAAVLRLRDFGECNFCNHQNPVISIVVNAIYVIATFLELVVVLSLRVSGCGILVNVVLFIWYKAIFLNFAAIFSPWIEFFLGFDINYHLNWQLCLFFHSMKPKQVFRPLMNYFDAVTLVIVAFLA